MENEIISDSFFPETIELLGKTWFKYSGTTHKQGQMRYHNNKSRFKEGRESILVDSNFRVIQHN